MSQSSESGAAYRQGVEVFSADTHFQSALAAALDYRGDVTLILDGGRKVEGFAFNHGGGTLDIYPKHAEDWLSIPVNTIQGLLFSGVDTAGATHRMTVTEVAALNPLTFELVLNDSMVFTPGQHVVLEHQGLRRTYSIVSTTLEQNLRLCFRLIQGGELTPRLAAIEPGTAVSVQGPWGNLLYSPDTVFDYFICTGTGISPFMSIIREYELQQAALIYGVRQAADAVYIDELEQRIEQVVVCSSRSPGRFQGRVTDWLKVHAEDLKPEATFYLCGNGHMVDDVVAFLQSRGVGADRIVTEHFFA